MSGLMSDSPRSDRVVLSDETWHQGSAPIAVVMISLNEAHNLEAVLRNLKGWAQEVFLVDSFSQDATVDIALKYGVHVVQRSFRGYGDQWNFAINELPVKSPWTMKLDPDERLTDQLKDEIRELISTDAADGLSVQRRLWFMGKPLPIRQSIVRVWRTGKCRFTDVLVNEHPLVTGTVISAKGEMEHHDSPNLHHWYEKQNRYSTAEALSAKRGSAMAAQPKLIGDAFQRRMWVKKNLNKIPFRYTLIFLYNYLALGVWRSGKVGYIWAKLRVEVYRARDYKLTEMKITGKETHVTNSSLGEPDERVKQC